MIEPDDAGRKASVKVSIVAVLVPPAGLIEPRTVSRRDIVVTVERRERHQVRVAERVRCIADERAAEFETVEIRLRMKTERRVLAGPDPTVYVDHVDAETVRRSTGRRGRRFGQPMDRLVAQPVLEVRIAESLPVFVPRP